MQMRLKIEARFIYRAVLSIALFIIVSNAIGQVAEPIHVYNFPELGWELKLPAKYKQWDKLKEEKQKEKGEKEILSANGFDSNTKLTPYITLISLHPDQFNYMDAQIQHYNESTDGNWEETQTSVNQMVYNTFKAQSAKLTIDTVTSSERIGGIQFHKFDITITFPAKFPNLRLIMYAALINGYDVGINFMYLEKEGAIGKEFLEYFYKSSFSKVSKNKGQ